MNNEGDLRVWWVPQMPMDAMYVDVESVEHGVFVMDLLARYDEFQFEHDVKGEYSNAGGIQVFENGEWVDWHDDATGEDDPYEFVKNKEEMQ